MAKSQCSQCECTEFEMVNHQPRNAQFMVNFVQCSECGTVIGVLDYHNAGEVASRVEGIVKKIAEKLGVEI